MTSANLIHEAGYPKLLPWDNPEGYGGEGGGSGFQDGGGHMCTCGQFMLMCDNNHHNIISNYPPVKINN